MFEDVGSLIEWVNNRAPIEAVTNTYTPTIGLKQEKEKPRGQ